MTSSKLSRPCNIPTSVANIQRQIPALLCFYLWLHHQYIYVLTNNHIPLECWPNTANILAWTPGTHLYCSEECPAWWLHHLTQYAGRNGRKVAALQHAAISGNLVVRWIWLNSLHRLIGQNEEYWAAQSLAHTQNICGWWYFFFNPFHWSLK